MRILLDTYVFLWWVMDDPRLLQHTRTIISESRNRIFVSAVSGWEMAIKAKLGKLSLPRNFRAFVVGQLTRNHIDVLPIQMSHALHVYRLPEHHRDPFDRMLVAQSQLENLPIVTGDPQITQYSVKTLW